MWRLSTAADDPAVITMWRALNAEDPAAQPPKESYMERTLAAFRAAPLRGRTVVLEVAARVVGYALLVAFWGNEQGGEVCVIDELFVIPAERGKGYATALIAAIEAGGPVWGEKPVALQLEVSPKNRRARALYERVGFVMLRNHCMRKRCED